MRHHQAKRTLSRPANQRKALLQTLARELILHNRINTTEAKAKELRPYIERTVTNARKNGVATIRKIEAQVGPDARTKLINEIVPRLEGREGGYTRIIKLPYRQSDSASMAMIEFVA